MGLGAGWSFLFDDRISLEGDAATLTTGTGAAVAFRRAGQSRHFDLEVAGPQLHQSFELRDAETINEQAAGLTRVYKRLGGVYRLTRIGDPNGNSIDIRFDSRGNLSRVGSGAGWLLLSWSGGGRQRLLSVADSAGRRVTFSQEGGRLVAVTDAAGARWDYAYADGRLTRATDPASRLLLRARYDARGRTVEAGDAAGAFTFDYGAGEAARGTTVTDPVGSKAVYAHTARGALTAVTDEEGPVVGVEYDSANRPVRVSDALGRTTDFAYDAQHRLTRQASGRGEVYYGYDGDGRVSWKTSGDVRTEYARDALGNLVSARATDPDAGFEVTRNWRGQVTSLAAGDGRAVAFEYDAAGRETAVTYSGVSRFEKKYDAAGRKVSERLPSGLEYTYAYDARGRLVRWGDDKGNSVTLERDTGGALARIVGADGKWVRATRDGAGRIVALTNSAGQTRWFTYDARGALTDYTDARGRRRVFEYDGRGRLRSVRSHGVAAASGSAAPRFARTLYGAAPFTAAARAQYDGGCLFEYDGWFDGDAYVYDYGMGCIDPMSLGWDDSGDGSLSSPGRCDDCRARHRDICYREWRAKYVRAIGTDLVATAACALITAGTLAVVCAAAAGLHAVLQVEAANQEYSACLLRIPDTCASFCPVT